MLESPPCSKCLAITDKLQKKKKLKVEALFKKISISEDYSRDTGL